MHSKQPSINQSSAFGRLAIIVVGAALYASGCGFAIKYKADPSSAATAVKGNVTLKVVDARPSDNGGTVKNHVGNLRSMGIPSRINDDDVNVAPRTVGEATADALGRVGLSGQGGQKTLVATITNYWADGFVGYAAQIAVTYDLQDASGKTIWNAAVKGGAGGASSRPGLFQKALADLANQAAAQFATPQFQQALAL